MENENKNINQRQNDNKKQGHFDKNFNHNNNSQHKHNHDKTSDNHKQNFDKQQTRKMLGVEFDDNGQTCWFLSNGENVAIGNKVVISTEQGVQIGVVKSTKDNFESNKNGQCALTKIQRKATEQDLKKEESLRQKGTQAKAKCVELAQKYKLEMKVIGIRCLFDESKMIFDFTSENRVDFRELVKDLASIFHTRIEMHQIGVRDEAKMMGWYGFCGQKCCCSRFLKDYGNATVKMAKNQNLSLNPQKISGVCGRLLCCLAYENEHYAETLKEMPKINSKVQTPDGEGIVIYNDLLKRNVRVKIFEKDDEYTIKQFPLADVNFVGKNTIINDNEQDE